MSRPTTCVNKGERKVPEGHKCTHYEMAPGFALKINDKERTTETVAVDAKICKANVYRYKLRWISGYTYATFAPSEEAPISYAQPIADLPQPKGAKRERKADHPNVPQRSEALEGSPRRGRVHVPEVRSTAGGEGDVPKGRVRKPPKELDLGW